MCVRVLFLVSAALSVTAPAPGMAQTFDAPPVPARGFGEFAPAVPPSRPKKIAAPVTHERVIVRSDRRPSVHPASVEMLGEAARKYRGIAEAGGWPILPADVKLSQGVESEAVVMLRRRLATEGDLAESDIENPVFDASLIEAVKRFQTRHGQSRTGLVAGPTLQALRVTAEARASQLEMSLGRLSARSFVFGARYVAVNIPAASVEAIANGSVEKRFVAVVGKKDRPSPEVETRITSINLNPTWTVPASIVKKDVIPRMRKEPGYLAKARIRIYGASGNEVEPGAIDWKTERALAFTLRQDSGASNALGQLRIDMPNRESVYMHDTPSKRLFLADNRFHSSGCVRVENIRDLAVWLLEGAKGWDRREIDQAIASGERKDIRPKEPVPVIWTYLTGYVTPDGTVHFRADIYGLDRPAGAIARKEPAEPNRKAAPPAKPPFDSSGLDAVAEAATIPTRRIVQKIDP